MGYFKSIRNRIGDIIPFDQSRITNAILKALGVANEGEIKDAERVSDDVLKALKKKYPVNHILGIEDIQDIVEQQLILADYAKAAKGYILYRQERARLREERREIPERVKKLAEKSKKYFKNPLGEFIYYRSYSRWMDSENRRETWIETVGRYMDFMKENLGNKLDKKEYAELKKAILNQEVMPSMRLMWSAGSAARATNVSAYNCSFIAPKKLKDFSEIMYILMCGAGVGFSVEEQTAQKFPQIKRQAGKKLPVYLIKDSKEGWADALYYGLNAWFNGRDVDFDFSQLRPAGARLKTMGGKSSGPAPLRSILIFARERILANQGKRLKPIDIHDIACKIAEIVEMGGVRRSALISLSDLDDEDMRNAKKGQFYLTDPQRSMANNSSVYNEKPGASVLMDEWIALAKSGTGERGIFNRGSLVKQLPDRRWKVFRRHSQTSGSNPCITGDTLVYVADGRGNIPIKELAKEGRDVPVFCFNGKGEITIRYMRNPRLTGKNLPVYKVTIDDGSVIRTTADHKFRLKSGDYKKVEDLKRGDSLAITTRFEASIKDIFPEANSKSQNYWWLNNGQARNEAEHRLIAGFYYNTAIPKNYVVHHKDRNAQNNNPDNLEIISKRNHDKLHSSLMFGDNNPMRRAEKEWGAEKWVEYKLKHSKNNQGEKNKNFSGVTDEELKNYALGLTKILGRRFSNGDWLVYAKKNNLPQHFSKWRQDHLGGMMGLAKWAAQELGLENIDADPRVVKSYKKHTSEGYNCEIINGQLIILKKCEICGVEFNTNTSKRECGVCGISCGLKRKWSDPIFRKSILQKINNAHQNNREKLRGLQTKVYSDLKFKLGREPFKTEWISTCKENGISSEICRDSSPFRYYGELRDFSATYNHKVISVEFFGYEDVYNGTVDEFHNFFIGGFESKTKNGKRKFVYLNNLQCGEIILRSKQFCNLSEVVARFEDTEKSLMKKIRIAAILGTYQSTLTNFPYLSKEWKKNCEEERLLGVSITGQRDCPVINKDNGDLFLKLKNYAVEINKEYAKRFGISQSTSVTCVKPSGTVSQLVDAASGLHPRHAPYYIRRVRISATDNFFKMLRDQKVPYVPDIGHGDEVTTYVFGFPVKAPSKSVFKNDLSAIEQLEYWKKVKVSYTEHNPSVTISVGSGEWIGVVNWVYENWDLIGGLSFLPREDHVYELAPFEEITKEQYEKMAAEFPGVDYSQILLYEKEDETHGSKELACSSGVCEIV